MHKTTFTCEVITPMFLAGADGQTPELRAPSIKGAMRFWWRAMNGHLSLEELKKREGAIFGSTEQRSKVLLRVKMLKKIIGRGIKGLELKYMAYGAEERSYFDVGTKFNIIIATKEQGLLEEVKKAFSLLTNLGGLGAKSRNGFGAFLCAEADSFSKICQYDVFEKEIEAPYTSISNQTEVYVSSQNFDNKSWKEPIKKLKYLYADIGKKSIKNKRDRVHIAAPYKKVLPPERHAKLYLMSLTKIKGKLRYTITYMPYEYLEGYPNLEGHKKIFNKWCDVTDAFNRAIEEEENREGYLINFTFNKDSDE